LRIRSKYQVPPATGSTLAEDRYGDYVINGSHVIIFSNDADADRAFFRDALGFPHVDAGEGWLICKLPPAEIAVHPVEGAQAHELYLMCDDVRATVEELSAKGVRCAEITDQGWGRLTSIRLPGGQELGLYEPLHPRATELEHTEDVPRKTTFVAYSEATIDELYYLAQEHANREVGAGKEAYDVKVGGRGDSLTADDTRKSWPATYKVRRPR
jgi:catechol 2,3-dioxygenase-like lactoylglutathione lyase family enzyme